MHNIWPIETDIQQTKVQVVYPDSCTNVCVDDPSTPDDFECNAPEWCYKVGVPRLSGRITNQQFAMLMDGVALKLAPKVNVFQELRYDNFSDTVGLWEALGGIDIELNPDYRKTVEWSPSEIQQMIAPGEVKEEPLSPWRSGSENAPLSGGAVLSDAQLAELANGNRVYVDESLYYEYLPATDTLRLINEIDGSVVKEGTFETVLQVNKDGSAVSDGSGILLVIGVVGIALSMSNRKSKS